MKEQELMKMLCHFSGTEKYHRHFLGVLYTDGVKYLADEANCYWLIDLVVSYQSNTRLKDKTFQLYELKVHSDKTAIIKIKDWDNRILAKQWLDYTDFPLKKFTIMFENNVLFLPSEY